VKYYIYGQCILLFAWKQSVEVVWKHQALSPMLLVSNFTSIVIFKRYHIEIFPPIVLCMILIANMNLDS